MRPTTGGVLRSDDRRVHGPGGVRPHQVLRAVRAGRLEAAAEPDGQPRPAVGILRAAQQQERQNRESHSRAGRAPRGCEHQDRRRLFEPDRNNFGPQIGFAWSPGRFDDKHRGARRLRGRLQPPSGIQVVRVPVQPAVLRRFHARPATTSSTVRLANDEWIRLSIQSRSDADLRPRHSLPITGPPVNINAPLQESRTRMSIATR